MRGSFQVKFRSWAAINAYRGSSRESQPESGFEISEESQVAMM
jgi:hypothetical protein